MSYIYYTALLRLILIKAAFSRISTGVGNDLALGSCLHLFFLNHGATEMFPVSP